MAGKYRGPKKPSAATLQAARAAQAPEKETPPSFGMEGRGTEEQTLEKGLCHQSTTPESGGKLFTQDMRDTLKARAFEVGIHLLGEPTVTKPNELRWGSKGSTSVSRDGLWYSHESGEGGDLVELWANTKRIPVSEALVEIRKYLGGEVIAFVPAPKTELPRWTHQQDSTWKWAADLPQEPLRVYLGRRGIHIPDRVKLRGLRYDRYSGKDVVLCACVGSDRKPMTIHRIWIAERSKQFWAGVQSKGAATLLIQGTSGTCVIAEGVETALSWAQLHDWPDVSLWATHGASNLPLWAHEACDKLVIAADADEAGLNAAKALADTHSNSSISVPPRRGFDWNDMLKGGAQ